MMSAGVVERFARSQRFAGGYRASFADWQRFLPPAQSAPLHHNLLNFVPFYSAPRRMRLRLRSQMIVANARFACKGMQPRTPGKTTENTDGEDRC
jgi:hypothetical protein